MSTIYDTLDAWALDDNDGDDNDVEYKQAVEALRSLPEVLHTPHKDVDVRARDSRGSVHVGDVAWLQQAKRKKIKVRRQ